MSSNGLEINLESMKTRQELVTDAIRTAILRGRFRPGDRLDQTELARELNVSRSPVREALRILTAEDLVTHYRHRGTVVTERSITELEELLFIRKLLEGAAAERGTPLLTDEALERMQQIIVDALSTDDVEKVLVLNHEFHAMIYGAYEQPHMMEMIHNLRNKIAPYNRLYLDPEGHKQAAWAEHQRIYEACLTRDGKRAAEETCRHLDNVFSGVITALRAAEEA